MRRQFHGLAVVAATTLFAMAPAARAQDGDAAPPETQWAFLVGVEKYKDPDIRPLKYTVDDIVGLREALFILGFQPQNVKILADPDQLRNSMDLSRDQSELLAPTKSNIETQLDRFLAQDINEDDLVLFAFSGHGMNDDRGEASYLLPSNGTADTETQIKLEKVLKQVAATKAKYRVVMIDACRSNQLLRRKLDFKTEIAPEDVWLLSSCAQGQKSYENPQLGHGEFMYHIIEGIKSRLAVKRNDGYLTGHDLFSYVHKKMHDTNPAVPFEDRQEPRLINIGGSTPVLGLPRSRPAVPRHGQGRAGPAGRAGLGGVPRKYLKANDNNLRKFDLSWVDLSGRELPEHIDLSDSLLFKTRLVGTKMPGATLTGAVLEEVDRTPTSATPTSKGPLLAIATHGGSTSRTPPPTTGRPFTRPAPRAPGASGGMTSRTGTCPYYRQGGGGRRTGGDGERHFEGPGIAQPTPPRPRCSSEITPMEFLFHLTHTLESDILCVI